MIKNFIENYKTAKKVVQEIHKGEWKPLYNEYTRCCCIMSKKGVNIWVTNTSFNCKLDNSGLEDHEKDPFGLFWRHWVWWVAQPLCRKEVSYQKQKGKEKARKYLK